MKGRSILAGAVGVLGLMAVTQGASAADFRLVNQTNQTILTFQVEARDEQELIARGLHKRQIVRVDRFAQRVSHKTAPR